VENLFYYPADIFSPPPFASAYSSKKWRSGSVESLLRFVAGNVISILGQPFPHAHLQES
jgi:hypothetical protein